jgi:hypothetical protein
MRNQGFSYYFCFMIKGSGAEPLTNDPDPGAQKHIRIRIRYTETNNCLSDLYVTFIVYRRMYCEQP